MRCVIQRVTHASVEVAGETVGRIGKGFMVLLGAENGDGEADSYLLYEMCAPHLTFLILTFRTMRGRQFFNMDGVYQNTGRLSAKNRFWQTYRIPVEAMPERMQTAYAAADQNRALDRLMRATGLVGAEESSIVH